MNETETRAELIDPSLKESGWGVIDGSRIRRAYPITLGRIETGGRRKRSLEADYLFIYKGVNLAILEAKASHLPLTEGLGQAKNYAEKLQIKFTFSSNGKGFYEVNMESGKEKELNIFPTPDELWAATFEKENLWRDKFSKVNYANKSGSWEIRSYQEVAVSKVLDSISEDQNRMLLTLATGTGKTSIAFQIIWKLFKSSWNAKKKPFFKPRILFLADRNNLADQAFNDFNSFGVFEDNAIARLDPEILQKKGKINTSANIFITIFQTFMTSSKSQEEPIPWFIQYPADFFDLIIIDECHRGGANNESKWRDILNHFKSSYQLGLTATPKREENVDTYKYFGNPIYTYSLKEGINDGFLTPFRVKQIDSSLDEYNFSSEDNIIQGEVDKTKTYVESDFNRIINIPEREKRRVETFMSLVDPNEKTLVFCANQKHALDIRDYINQKKLVNDPNYCHRVTADEGELGNQWLRMFQDNERTIPTILTTSQKLSTGVNARNIRNIVLLRPINSLIEFKQIIGRGTRLFEGKSYFTIYDFVNAHNHFYDPEWDGEPEPPEIPKPRPKPPNPNPPNPDNPDEPDDPIEQELIQVELGDKKKRNFQNFIVTTFWHEDGTPINSQEFLEILYGELPNLFKNEEELRKIWSNPDTRSELLSKLSAKGFGDDQLHEIKKIINAENSDLYDVLSYISYCNAPLTRIERANLAKTFTTRTYSSKEQLFVDFVLQQYVSLGVNELAREKLSSLLQLIYPNSISDAIEELGSPDEIAEIFIDFQKYLYVE